MVLLTSYDGFDQNQEDDQAPKPNQLQLMEGAVSVTESHQGDSSSGNNQGSTINCNELHNKIKLLMKENKEKGERVDEAQEDIHQLRERLGEMLNHHQQVSFYHQFKNLNNLTYSITIIM